MGAANLTFKTGALLLSARASRAFDLELLCRSEWDLVEYSLMGGYGARVESMLFHATAGVGYAGITRNEPRSADSCLVREYDTYHHRTINFPLEMGLAWDVRVLSFGPTLMANINPVRSDFAVLLTFSIGKIR